MSSSDYFTAVQVGRARVRKALERLQEAAGPSYPVLFLKMGIADWTPVGEEELFALVSGKEGTAAVVICDSDGNAKAMSQWISEVEAARITGALEAKGLARYDGEVKLPL
jgi:hypothetical protein